MYKTQKGEIATFISIATLIGIVVFTFVASNIVSSKKETVNTKAEDLSCSCGTETDYGNCEAYETEDYICDYNTETNCSDPDDSESCSYNQVPVYCTRDTDTCMTYGTKCIDNCPSDTNDINIESQDTTSYDSQNEIAQQDFGCENTDLSCDTSGNECNGTIDGYCYSGGWGTCCRPYSEEEVVADSTQSTEEQNCSDLGGECIYDGWGSNIDESLYEKISGKCDWFEACYKKNTNTEENENIDTTPISEENESDIPVIKINDREIPEGQDTTVDGINLNASLNSEAEETYHYSQSNPADIKLEEDGNGVYRFSCEEGIQLNVSFGQQYVLMDENGNSISTGNSFNNVCQ